MRIEVAITIDSILNKKVLNAARITRENAWLVPLIDEDDKQNIVLQYDLKKVLKGGKKMAVPDI